MSDCATLGPENFEFSVVVALTAASADLLRECLRSVEKSCTGIRTEIIVPYDNRLVDTEELAGEFAGVRFVDCRGSIPQGTAFHSHLRLDILRARGLKEAEGWIVALIEDCEIVSEGWARAMLAAHHAEPAVVGGAIENATNSLLAEASYVCDFAAYSASRPAGPLGSASDANVSYQRAMVCHFSESWSARYDEKSFHEELRRHGLPISFEPTALVYQNRGGLTIGDALRERFAWGRWYGAMHSPEISRSRRLIFVLCAWVLPSVLTLRAVPAALSPRRLQLSIFVLPVVFVLRSAWVCGEWCGYLMPDRSSTL